MHPLEFKIVEICFDLEGELKYGDYGTVPAKWKCPPSRIRCEVFVLRKTSEQAVSPLTDFTDSLGVLHGLDRGEVHCT